MIFICVVSCYDNDTMNTPESFKDISKELAQRLSDPAIDRFFALREKLYEAYESDEYEAIQYAEEDLAQHLEHEGLVGAEVLVTGKLRPHEMSFADTWEDFIARHGLAAEEDDEGEYVYVNGQRLFMGALYEALLHSDEGYRNTRAISFFEYDDAAQSADDIVTDIGSQTDDVAVRKAHSLEVRQWVADDSIAPDMVARLDDIEEIELLQPSAARIRQELEEEYADELEMLRMDLLHARNEQERIELLHDMRLTLRQQSDSCYDINQAVEVFEAMIDDEFDADTAPYLLTLRGQDDEYMQITGTIRCIRLLQTVANDEVTEVRPVIEIAVPLPDRNDGAVIGAIDPSCIVKMESLRPHKDEVQDFMAKVALRTDGGRLGEALASPDGSGLDVIPVAYIDRLSEEAEEAYRLHEQQYQADLEAMHRSYEARHEEHCRMFTDRALARIAELVTAEYPDEEALLRAHIELQATIQQLQVISSEYNYPALQVRIDARNITHHTPQQSLIRMDAEDESYLESVILERDNRPFDMVNGVIYDAVAEGVYDTEMEAWRLKVSMIFDRITEVSYSLQMPGAQISVLPRMAIGDISHSNMISLQRARVEHAREVLEAINHTADSGSRADEALRALSRHMCEFERQVHGAQVEVPPQLFTELVDEVNKSNIDAICEGLSTLLASRVIMATSGQSKNVVQVESVIQTEDGELVVCGRQLGDMNGAIGYIPVSQLNKAYISRFFQE